MPSVLRPRPEAVLTPAARRGARTGHQIFFRHWLRDPLGMGAASPSSNRVAEAMAGQVAPDRPGVVLELGGGTGSLTGGLLAAGCPVEKLVVLEREPALAQHLARRFPGLRVIAGDACDLAALLDDAGIEKLAAAVSSLPIKWFPRDAQRRIIDACFDRLGDGALLQLTNALASPIPARDFGLVGTEVVRVWAHFLPVQIWRYRRAEASSA